jgi:hypothetical protein
LLNAAWSPGAKIAKTFYAWTHFPSDFVVGIVSFCHGCNALLIVASSRMKEL